MRIIGGRLGGLRFKGPPDRVTRPTADRVREGLASILEAREAFEGAVVLDLFAGTGALSFEALSRGAARALAVDKDRRAVRAMGKVAAALGVTAQIDLMCLDLLRDPGAAAEKIRRNASTPFNLVFADPPYRDITALPDLLVALAKEKMVGTTTLVVVEHATKEPPTKLVELVPVASYRYGDTTLALLRFQRLTEEYS
jgi:16S rRNA (guanine966-N2)-methyltransferase